MIYIITFVSLMIHEFYHPKLLSDLQVNYGSSSTVRPQFDCELQMN